MPILKVEITRWVSFDQPWWVECVFLDAYGKRHVLHEKEPVIGSDLPPDKNADFPVAGEIACEIEREWEDDKGRKLVCINTDLPWHIASTEEQTKFIVVSSEVLQKKPD